MKKLFLRLSLLLLLLPFNAFALTSAMQAVVSSGGATSFGATSFLSDANLQYAYSFENNMNDSSSNGNTLTAGSGIAYNTTYNIKSGTYSLYGTTSYGSYRTSDNLSSAVPGKVSSNFTIGGWVRVTSLAATRHLFGHITPGTANSYDIVVYTNGKLIVEMYDSTPTQHIELSTTALSVDTNYFVAMTWDGTNVRYYIGTEAADAAEDASSPMAVSSMYYNATSSARLSIGGYVGVYAQYSYIDDVAGFNRVLSLSEMISWQNHGLNGLR